MGAAALSLGTLIGLIVAILLLTYTNTFEALRPALAELPGSRLSPDAAPASYDGNVGVLPA